MGPGLWRWGFNHAVQLLIAYFGLSMAFLFLEQRRLLLIGLSCTAIFSLFLRNRTENDLTAPPFQKGLPVLQVAHFSTAGAAGKETAFLQAILQCGADFISVESMDPVWKDLLDPALQRKYPYRLHYRKGLSVWSTSPPTWIDTFLLKGQPVVKADIIFDGNPIHLMAVQLQEAQNYREQDLMERRLKALEEESWNLGRPRILSGTWGAVSWAPELVEFRNSLGLKNSRKRGNYNSPTGNIPILDIPFDHIFFSKELLCLDFQSIGEWGGYHFGIAAEFQNLPQIAGHAGH